MKMTVTCQVTYMLISMIQISLYLKILMLLQNTLFLINTIKKADKDGGVVVWKKDLYIAERQLKVIYYGCQISLHCYSSFGRTFSFEIFSRQKVREFP